MQKELEDERNWMNDKQHDSIEQNVKTFEISQQNVQLCSSGTN